MTASGRSAAAASSRTSETATSVADSGTSRDADAPWWRRLWIRVAQTRAWRAWERYGTARGDLLAAGIAYFSFFSLFPALALAAVVFGFVLQGRPDLLSAVGEALNTALPGFVKTDTNPEGLVQLAAPETATLSWAGALAMITLVLGGLGWIGSLREGLRAVFGASGAAGNAVLVKLRDLGVLALLGVSLVASAVLSSTVGAGASWVAERIGLAGQPWVVVGAGIVVSLVVDTAIMILLLRVLSGVSLPWPAIRSGAMLGGVGMTLLKLVGAQVVARATSNPLFGSLVVVVGLLFWLNLMARLVLISASWAANDLDSGAGPEGSAASAEASTGEPSGLPCTQVAGVDRGARAAAGLPTFGARTRDRVTLVAGAVLGAGAAVAAGAVRRLLPVRRG
jgi:membrane protein